MKNEGADQAATLFGYIEKIEVVNGEFGFVTEVMTEREFADKADLLPEMITRIRIEA